MKQLVYISLGSNLGDRRFYLNDALRRLEQLGQVKALSAFYETEPVEVEGLQPAFLNCAAAVETELDPLRFLQGILAIEQAMGRRRIEPKGPRTIDVDIVLWGDTVVDTPDLTIPHAAMHLRRFVLEPLEEIAPNAMHPVLKRTVADLLRLLPANSGSVSKVG